jgi:subtilisin family serine protease
MAALVGLGMSGEIDATGPGEQSNVRPEVLDALGQQPQVSVIISLRETPSLLAPPDVAALRSDVAIKQERVLSSLSAADFTLTHKYQVAPALAGRITASGVEKLAAHPDVIGIGPNLELHASLGESVSQINADAVQALGLTGAGVVVAVLDTGIDTDHPDLVDDLLSENCFLDPAFFGPCPSNNQPTDSGPGSAEDDNGHGSHVSGIITSGGVVGPVGVAPDAGIRSYKVLNSAGDGFLTDIIAAAEHVVANYPGTDFVNLSLSDGINHAPGTCDSLIPAVTSLIDTARAAGTLVFASSGNEAYKNGMGYPACISNVLSVGAVYDADLGSINWDDCVDVTTAQDQAICFSNSDSSLDLLAPGCATTSAFVGGGTGTLCGTSMATPHAVGAGALLLEDDPTLTPDQLEICLEASGVPLMDAANGITTPRIDALAGLDCRDTDNDGCSDLEENGPDETLGGRRDPNNFWDFYDPTRDGIVDFFDFLALLRRYGTMGDPSGFDPDAAEPTTGEYWAAVDRGGTTVEGGDPWDELPPDGEVDFFDFLSLLRQYGHDCTAPP